MFAYQCSRMLSGRRRRSRFSRRDPAEKETSSQPSTAFLSNALAALVLPQEEVLCCFPRARLIMSLGDYDFPKKKKHEKGFGDAIEQWDRSVVEIPWRRARSLERGGRGGGKSPAREANGSRWSPRADGAAERRSRLLRRKLLPAVVPVTPVVPLPRPPSTQACI